MHVRKKNRAFERLHTAAPALAGVASNTTTGRNVVSGGSAVGSVGGPVRRRAASGRVVAGVGIALVVLVALGTVTLHSGSAQASVAPANSVTAFGAAPALGAQLGTQGVAPVASFAGIAATPSGHGYWVAAQDGGVFAFGDASFFGSAGATPLNQPIVGIAATPSGHGYWLVGRDGGVFAFGDAPFLGSAGGRRLNQPIVGMAAAAGGRGYWLVARDGGVFTFGAAPFLGSVAQLDLGSEVVGIAATPSHNGYWLASAGGGVFSFGDATFAGSESTMGVTDAAGIAAGRTGYYIARRGGQVLGFGTGADRVGLAAAVAPGAMTTGIAAPAPGGFWTVQGALPPPVTNHMDPFLVCTREHESSHVPPAYDTGYAAVNPSGTYRGAYQFDRSTWNNAALRAGRLDLVGVDPAAASVADQDLLALDLYHWQGAGPWMGRCAGL